MTARLPSIRITLLGAETPGQGERYECTYCGVTFGEWPDGCPDCGQIVVRVVDPGPVPDD